MDDAELPEDLPVLGEARFLTLVQFLGHSPEACRAAVRVSTLDEGEGEPSADYWAVAAEYFLAVAAQKSPFGFEQALDTMREGAMGYRTLKVERDEVLPDDGG